MAQSNQGCVVVTGAGRRGSIGEAVVHRLHAAGYHVLASDISKPLASHPDYEVAPSDDLTALGALDPERIAIAPCDVTRF
jgi:NAD(P)-dependent dehydrogenase (short-subunit alcohol dehydrogenase family)